MSISRISANYAFVRSMHSITDAVSRLDDVREKLNTGKEVNRASDDPTAMQKIYSLGTSIKKNERYIKNIEKVLGNLNATSTSLSRVEDILIELNEIANLSSSNGATSAERTAHMQQVELLLEELVSLANNKHEGKFIFGGTNCISGTCDLSKPYNIVEDSDGYITGVIPNPNGINNLINTTIMSGVTESINISGSAPFQPNGQGGEGDIFNVVINLRNALRDNDIDAIKNISSNIDDAINQVLNQEIVVGAKIGRLETQRDVLDSSIINEMEAKSSVEDADYAKLLIKYSTLETLFNSTLGATAKLLQNSLMSFI